MCFFFSSKHYCLHEAKQITMDPCPLQEIRNSVCPWGRSRAVRLSPPWDSSRAHGLEVRSELRTVFLGLARDPVVLGEKAVSPAGEERRHGDHLCHSGARQPRVPSPCREGWAPRFSEQLPTHSPEKPTAASGAPRGLGPLHVRTPRTPAAPVSPELASGHSPADVCASRFFLIFRGFDK